MLQFSFDVGKLGEANGRGFCLKRHIGGFLEAGVKLKQVVCSIDLTVELNLY